MSLIAKVTIECLCVVIISCAILIHSFRLYYLSKQNSSDLKSFKLCILNVKNISMALLILAFFLRLKDFTETVLKINGNILSLPVCNILIKSQISAGGLARFLCHLFVAVRAQINSNVTQFSSVWHKIGLLSLSVDIFLSVFVWTPQAQIISYYSPSGACAFSFSLIVPILYSLSDLIIGSYCLCIFVIPLRKYIELERQECAAGNNIESESNSLNLGKMVRKIIFWSSLSLISSMLAIIIVMIENHAAEYVYSIDLTFNVVCIIMQFRDISRESLPVLVAKMLDFVQCKYSNEMTKDEINLSKVAAPDISKDTTESVQQSKQPKQSETNC